ncbi:acyltransferase family protein [Seonamhaeicola sp. NFXS20]|uniref:acyltransferase n=1 Tax=Seonamhaeicola sp. NFXS20 TaxID=2816959 RepID=UPI003B8D02E5
MGEKKIGIALLRILATFSVIVIHVSAPLVVDFGKIPMFDWHVANFFDSISRYSVPIFLMISGALLLNKDYDLMEFLKKRFVKIMLPFLMWSIIYSLLNRYVFKKGSFDIIKIVRDVFYGSEYHLWFIFTLLGVYLTVPILRKWIKQATKKEILYVLIIWLVTLFLTIPRMKIYFPKIDLTYFSGFIGYFILGYYLSLSHFKRIVSVSLIVFGVLVTIFGTYHFTVKNAKFYFYFYEYLCLNTFMVSSGVFMLFNKLNCVNPKHTNMVTKISQACFGIYLMHPLVLKLFKSIGLDIYIINPIASILLVAIACFVSCFIMVSCLRNLRFGYLVA